MKELLQVIFEEVAVSMPANPVRFVRDTMHAMLGSDASEAEAKEASGGCFLRVHVECGFRGQRVWEHVSRRAPGKGFKAGSMREWRRQASGLGSARTNTDDEGPDVHSKAAAAKLRMDAKAEVARKRAASGDPAL